MKVVKMWTSVHCVVEVCLEVAASQQMVGQPRDVDTHNGERVPGLKKWQSISLEKVGHPCT